MISRRYGSLATFLIGIALSFVLAEGKGADTTSTTVDLKPVSYSGLTEAVRGRKGKVVVVDLWADF